MCVCRVCVCCVIYTRNIHDLIWRSHDSHRNARIKLCFLFVWLQCERGATAADYSIHNSLCAFSSYKINEFNSCVCFCGGGGLSSNRTKTTIKPRKQYKSIVEWQVEGKKTERFQCIRTVNWTTTSNHAILLLNNKKIWFKNDFSCMRTSGIVVIYPHSPHFLPHIARIALAFMTANDY